MRRRKWIFVVLLVIGAAVGEIMNAIFHQPWWYGPWIVFESGIVVPGLLVLLLSRRWRPKRQRADPAKPDQHA
jgi:hypothetical protein